MIDYLTNRLKLKYRIYAGSLLAALVAFVVILITFVTFNKTTNDFKSFVSFSKQSQIELLLTAKIAEIQRQALIYTYEGHLSAADEVLSLIKQLLAEIEQEIHTDQSQIEPTITIVKNRLQNYYEAFLLVKQQRDLQQHLLNVEFRNYATEVETLIAQLIQQSSQNSQRQVRFQQILSTLLLVEKNLFRYLDSLDANYVKAARISLGKASAGLKQLETEKNTVTHNKTQQAIDTLKLFDKSFVQAVQRTQGYLYLVNVVMAAEAYEILYQTRKLSSLLTAQMEETQQTILTSIKATLQLLVMFSGLVLIFQIVFAYGIGLSITRPIMRLTQTFKKLTQGANDTNIPKYVLADEIGELTQAATAFRNKNIQTEQLLQQSVELTRALANSKKELERSNDELEQFVYTVSHDLKSPLVTSMGFIGIIRNLSDQGKYQQAIEKLDKVIKSNERMGQLINDLLELSRVGRVNLDKKAVDLNELLAKFAQNFSEQLDKFGFLLTIEPDLPTIYVNESRVLQVFENILSNAVKYVHNANASPKLEIGVKPDSEYILIYCKDNGSGIDQKYHQKIFGLFYRLDSKQEGTGIGLAVAKKVMKFHNGDIWVESFPGEGATFWLKFPKTNAEDNLSERKHHHFVD